MSPPAREPADHGAGQRRQGLLLIISSPSGAGKTSLSRRLVTDCPDLELSVSVTTRPPRPGEQSGREYRFVGGPAFAALVGAGEFIEHADVHEHRYGTPRSPVEAALNTGRDVLFDIDWQGAKTIAQAYPSDAVRVFILPPSMVDLQRRLKARAQDSADVITRRLGRAKAEIAQWGDYDYVIVNDDFERAYAELAQIYAAERMRRARNPWLLPLVERLLAEPL